jgi:hypothetical protein
MPTIKTQNASGVNPAPIPVAQEDVTVFEELSLLAAQVANGNVLQMMLLPAGCIPVGYALRSTDLDTGSPTITFDLGILNAAGNAISTDAKDGGDEWIDGSTLPQAGGIVLHTASAGAFDVLHDVQASDVDRIVAVVMATGAATAAAGVVGLELTYRTVR